MKNEVDVVIISWARNLELLEITKIGLNSLYNSDENVIFHVYVVESNHKVTYDEYNDTDKGHTCTTIHPESEFGYHKYLNLGRKMGKSKYVVLCNSDLTYEKNWASEIIHVMEVEPKYLSASPWCPQTLGDNTDKLDKVYEGHVVRGQIAGWCIFQKRSIYDIIGDLDERFTFWCSDDDYAMTLQVNDVAHCLVPRSVVNHHDGPIGKTAENESDSKLLYLTESQYSKFLDKWGMTPPSFKEIQRFLLSNKIKDMKMRVTYIIPTVGRKSISKTVESILSEDPYAKISIQRGGTASENRNILLLSDIIYNQTLENHSDWICFIDDDDYYAPGYLFELDTNYDMVVFRMNQAGTIIPRNEQLYAGNIGINFAIKSSVIGKIIMQDGTIDTRFLFDNEGHAEDWRFIEKILEYKPRVKITKDVFYICGSVNHMLPPELRTAPLA